jgi:hypothetical protein
MNKFIGKFSHTSCPTKFYFYPKIERLQTQICDLEMPNENELHFQLSGLKQVCVEYLINVEEK